MAQTNTLRTYQASILEKLEQAKAENSVSSAGYLGVIIGEKYVLISMQEITETLPLLEIAPVPLVKPWFMGMANVRGVLYAINDLNALVFDEKASLSSNSRILLLHHDVASHVGFVVSRLIGLRKLDNMQVVNVNTPAAFCMRQQCYEDENQQIWSVMDFKKLIEHKEYIQSF